MKNEEKKTLCIHCDEYIYNKGLTNHLKHRHNVTFIDYIKNNLNLFPTYHFCPICNLNVCENNKTKWPGTCSAKCSKIMRSQQRTGTVGWSRGLTKDTHPGLLINSIKARERTLSGHYPMKFVTADTETIRRKKLSDLAKNRKGESAPFFGKTHSPETIHKIFNNRNVKTDIEQQLSNFLDEKNIEYYFQFFINDTSTHSYDFKIKGIPLIIELDGDYWHGGPGCVKHFHKVNSIIAVDNLKTETAINAGYEIIRFWGSEIKNNFDEIKSIILNKISKFRDNEK